MNLRANVKAAAKLLSTRDRRVILLLVGAQVGLSLLDLAGILLLGMVAALATADFAGGSAGFASNALKVVGIETTDPLQTAAVLALVAAIALISKSVVSFLITRRTFRFLANRQALISGQLASSLLSQPLLFVQRKSSQETAYALTAGVSAAMLGVLGGAVVIVSELALVGVLALGLAAIDFVVMVFTVVFFVIVALLLHRILASWAARLGSQVSDAEIASYESVQEALRTYREVSVSGRRYMYVEKFRALRYRATSVQADLQIMGQVSKYVFEIALVVGGGILVLTQLVTRDLPAAIAVIVVFLAAASRIMPSLLRMQSASLQVRSAAGIAASTFELAKELRQTSALSNLGISLSVDNVLLIENGLRNGYEGFSPEVCLSHVSMTYPSAQIPALTDVSITVGQGTSLAIVGSTGAGKSTLADLLLGILVPGSGTVSINGVDPTTAIVEFPGSIAYVPQDIALVNGTIRDNVALGLPPELATDDLIWEALERSHLASFLKSQRDGLDTVVGEHGVRLSGGQRQRLGLARALYTRPKLVVLDEATSALDAETEQAISQSLEDLEGDVTLIVIAHRLATIRNCDQVAYLETGRLAAIGTFTQVRNEAPDFNRQAELLGL